jgi:hypothetical protein
MVDGTWEIIRSQSGERGLDKIIGYALFAGRFRYV